jgi:methylmalonyl-CoA/ethylmalonyl-CoA epimerase
LHSPRVRESADAGAVARVVCNQVRGSMATGLEGIVYPKLSHVGIIVGNMDAAGRDASARLGLPGIVRRATLHFADALYRGTRISFAADFGYVEMGNTSLELIQPIGSDPSPYRDVLDEHGDSMHHLAYVVPSIEQRLLTARQANAPVSVVLDGQIPGGEGRFVYVEGLLHGALVELLELTGSAR